ncbi:MULTISPECIES: hypothetical protein [unclassified Janthinobacterium]|uniref:hypothetical protein n=1 Tax=unclassified Janthinobacterium TaxID=2610881 RepID=UPI001618349D|nr:MULTISPECIES: hypothetical protein [unclassified Janthinobacterium]MBB5367619.1 putative membrane protein [Janthinobacterium sp. K2C7]MBB5379903.1 putative membrane protein [Janthinobacterium sp. K2Li3]MBB5386001.1 putative membrane protein [Janthinobacterium sp. K2E3]
MALHVYDQLVSGPNDFIGALAYSLYKQTKVEWIIHLKAANGGVEPTSFEIQMFHDFNVLPAQLQGYKDRATALTVTFLSVATKERLDQLSTDTVQSALAAKFDATHQAVTVELISYRRELAAKRGIYGWLAEVGAALITNFLTIILVALIAYGYGKLNAVNSAVDGRVSQELLPAPKTDN